MPSWEHINKTRMNIPAVGLILQSHVCNRLLALRLKIQAYTSSTYRLYTVVEDLDVWSV